MRKRSATQKAPTRTPYQNNRGDHFDLQWLCYIRLLRSSSPPHRPFTIRKLCPPKFKQFNLVEFNKRAYYRFEVNQFNEIKKRGKI